MAEKTIKTLGAILGFTTFLGAQELKPLEYKPSPDFDDSKIVEYLEDFPSINSEDMIVDSTDTPNDDPELDSVAVIDTPEVEVEPVLQDTLPAFESSIMDTTPQINIPYVAEVDSDSVSVTPAIIPVDSVAVDTPEVEVVPDTPEPEPVVEEPVYLRNVEAGIQDALDKVREIYAQSDARFSRDLKGSRSDLKKSLGSKKTYADDDKTLVDGNLRYMRKDLEKTLGDWDNFPMGTAAVSNLRTSLAYLEQTKKLTKKQLKKTKKDYNNFKKLTENAETLPSELQEGIQGEYADFNDRISKLNTTLTELDSTIDYMGQNIPEAKGFDSFIEKFKFSGDDDSKKIVDSFRDVYNQEKSRLDKASFASWVNEYFNPQADEVIKLWEDVLNNKYVNPNRLEKLAKHSDGVVELNFIHSIQEAESNLSGSLGKIKALTKQNPYKIQEEKLSFKDRWELNKLERAQRKAVLEQKEAKIKSDYEGAIHDVSAGYSVGKDGFYKTDVGLRVGNFGAKVSYGGASDKTFVDFKTPAAPNGIYGEVSKINKDFSSLGLGVEYYKGIVDVGVGVHGWKYNQNRSEIIRNKEGLILDGNTDSESKGHTSYYFNVGVNIPLGKNKRTNLRIGGGNDSKYGLYGSVGIGYNLNKPKIPGKE